MMAKWSETLALLKMRLLGLTQPFFRIVSANVRVAGLAPACRASS